MREFIGEELNEKDNKRTDDVLSPARKTFLILVLGFQKMNNDDGKVKVREVDSLSIDSECGKFHFSFPCALDQKFSL